MKLRTLLVDDEPLARENLRMLIADFCPEIEVVGTAGSVTEAKQKIEELTPEVVFLDIRMPSGAEGFQLLEEVPDKKFLVVFVTAFKDYAIKAFNANAIHYVLKPVDIDDLQTAVKKLLEVHKTVENNPTNFADYVETLNNLSSTLNGAGEVQRIAIHHSKGFKIVEDTEIIHLEADGNCTHLHFEDGGKYLDTRTLRIYEDILNKGRFFRTHKSHIVNLQHVREYLNDDGHMAILKGGKQIPISRSRLPEFIAQLKSL